MVGTLANRRASAPAVPGMYPARAVAVNTDTAGTPRIDRLISPADRAAEEPARAGPRSATAPPGASEPPLPAGTTRTTSTQPEAVVSEERG